MEQLYQYALNYERVEISSTDDIYLNYSNEEKKRLDSYIKVEEIQTIPNEFAFLISDTEDNTYLLVNDRNDYQIDNEMFEKIPCSLAELGILSEYKNLFIDNNVSYEMVYDSLFINEDTNYKGHLFEDISFLFKSCSLYQINKEYIFINDDKYRLFSCFLLSYLSTNSSKFQNETVKLIEDLVYSEIKLSFYNIAVALNSNQWTHIFLETYRLIEHVFPALALKKLSEKNISIPAIQMAQILEEVIAWRPNEESSIYLIFDEIKNDTNCNTYIQNVRLLMKNNQEKIGKWYYKQVRNQIVHYRASHENVFFTDSEWNSLLQMNLVIIKYLYIKYKAELQAC